MQQPPYGHNPAGVPSNPYAPPVAAAPYGAVAAVPGQDFFQLGDKLVVRKGVVLPDLCIVSGQPTGGLMKHRKVSWVPPWVFIIFVLSPLIGVIVMMIVRKSGALTYAWSQEQRSRRKRGLLIGLGILASTFLLIPIGAAADLPALALLGFVTFLTGIIVASAVGQPFKIAKIDRDFIQLKVKPGFLTAMQPYLGQPQYAPLPHGQPQYGPPPSPY